MTHGECIGNGYLPGRGQVQVFSSDEVKFLWVLAGYGEWLYVARDRVQFRKTKEAGK